MKLVDFQKDKELVAQARQLLNTSIFQIILNVMREEHPKHYREPNEHVGFHAPHKLGRIHGYDEFETNLLKTAVIEEPKEAPQATFAPPE